MTRLSSICSRVTVRSTRSTISGLLRYPFVTALLIAVSGLLVPTPPIYAQSPTLSDIPPEYQEAIADLVDRYEELRVLLREQIQLNRDLFSQEEIDAALAELRAEVAALEAENLELRTEYKAMRVAFKNAEDEALAWKEELAKVQFGLGMEIDVLEAVIAGTEEENLLQVGATFSPAGSLGLIGLLNLPGTNLSLLAQGDYELRDRRFTTGFGVTFSYLPQRALVEGWERFRNRIGNREVAKAQATEDMSAAELRALQRDAAADAAAATGVSLDDADTGADSADSDSADSEPEDSDPADNTTEPGSGTLFRPAR